MSGASITLYQVGATGPGSGALSLLPNPVLSSADGRFTIANDYTCPSSSTQVYLVARGGNPGVSTNVNNQASVLMTALGDCGSLSATTVIQINEVTTVASAWALAQFLAPGAMVGSSATNATGLRNAFLVASNLANSTTGAAPGASLPAGATVETKKLNTLADALASCVHSDGGSACNPLLQAASASAIQPSNTLDAALNIIRNPGNNLAAVFQVASQDGPFEPQLAAAPSDFSMTITYRGGGLKSPAGLAVDSTGSVWAANYFGSAATKFSPTGQPASAGGFNDASLNESYGVAIDPHDNAWITNEESTNGVNQGLGSITEFSSSGQVRSGAGFAAGGIDYPYAVAAAADGSIWVADYGRSGVSLLNQSGSSLLGSSGLSSASLSFPVAVALDANQNGWFASQGGALRVTPEGTVSSLPCGCVPSSIAFDGFGNLWLADYYASRLYELNPSGAILQDVAGLGGLDAPQNLAIDGDGRIWVTNYHGGSISGFGSATQGSTSVPLALNGFGLDISLSTPFGIAIDAGGDLWVSSFNQSVVTEFVGLASPVRTPLQGPAQQP